eukprot:TRINITY_DN50398_c0_g1_i1.p1 TRINITY_DN50398_c0_g1~~TRINITY_DN50398_c0_g1_i1.p1  ORF type:complete len:204 (+),score=14.69 TRINITY_DN50398_c0_g1_i1:62-673(+)
MMVVRSVLSASLAYLACSSSSPSTDESAFLQSLHRVVDPYAVEQPSVFESEAEKHPRPTYIQKFRSRNTTLSAGHGMLGYDSLDDLNFSYFVYEPHASEVGEVLEPMEESDVVGRPVILSTLSEQTLTNLFRHGISEHAVRRPGTLNVTRRLKPYRSLAYASAMDVDESGWTLHETVSTILSALSKQHRNVTSNGTTMQRFDL